MRARLRTGPAPLRPSTRSGLRRATWPTPRRRRPVRAPLRPALYSPTAKPSPLGARPMEVMIAGAWRAPLAGRAAKSRVRPPRDATPEQPPSPRTRCGQRSGRKDTPSRRPVRRRLTSRPIAAGANATATRCIRTPARADPSPRSSVMIYGRRYDGARAFKTCPRSGSINTRHDTIPPDSRTVGCCGRLGLQCGDHDHRCRRRHGRSDHLFQTTQTPAALLSDDLHSLLRRG